jgi:phosphoribosyl-ATP pyrophosphohydrolase
MVPADRVPENPGSPRIPDVLDRIAATIEQRRRADPSSSYVAALFARGGDAIMKKIGEEATETVMAAKDGDRLRIAAEVADLWFHCLVLLALHGLGPDDVRAELARREGVSGIDEKSSRKA